MTLHVTHCFQHTTILTVHAHDCLRPYEVFQFPKDTGNHYEIIIVDNNAIFPEVYGVTKVSNSKSDLQGHSRSLLLVSFDKPPTVSYNS